MKKEIRAWTVTYQHCFTKEIVKGSVHAVSKRKALSMARENCTGAASCWEVLSIEETHFVYNDGEKDRSEEA